VVPLEPPSIPGSMAKKRQSQWPTGLTSAQIRCCPRSNWRRCGRILPAECAKPSEVRLWRGAALTGVEGYRRRSICRCWCRRSQQRESKSVLRRNLLIPTFEEPATPIVDAQNSLTHVQIGLKRWRLSDSPNPKQIELRLKSELDEAERHLRDAPPHEKAEARLRYRHAIQRFSRLVMDGLSPQD
jgi:hypothetical protein